MVLPNGNVVIRVLIICLFLATPLYAMDGEVYFGHYFDIGTSENNKQSAPNTDEVAEYIFGVSLNKDIWLLNVYGDISTLMDQRSNTFFHPSSVSYTTGLSLGIEQITISLEHQCWHPIDNAPRGNRGVEEYNRVMIKYRF